MATPQSTEWTSAAPDRFPMSWESYWTLDESVHGEYFDGQLVMAPNPDLEHQLVCSNLWSLLKAVLPPGYRVTLAPNWSPADGVNFIPDVIVHTMPKDPQPHLIRISGIPVLVVEVVSSNRSHDLLVKRAKYAAFGLPNYWIVDRDAGVLQALQLHGTRYREVASIGNEPVELDFGIARVTLSMPQLLTY